MEFDTHKFYTLESGNIRFMCYGVVRLNNVLHAFDVRAGINLVVKMEEISQETIGHIVFRTSITQSYRIRSTNLKDAKWFCGEGMKYLGTAKQFFRWLHCLAGTGSCHNVVTPTVAEHTQTTNGVLTQD